MACLIFRAVVGGLRRSRCLGRDLVKHCLQKDTVSKQISDASLRRWGQSSEAQSPYQGATLRTSLDFVQREHLSNRPQVEVTHGRESV